MNKKAKTLKKICRVRRYLIREGKSKIREWEAIKAVQIVEKHVDAFPNASNEFWERFIQNNKHYILTLIPENKAAESFKNQLNIN